MAQTDMLKRFLEAGMAFTKLTRERAEEIVRELVKAGELGTEQASTAVEDLLERSRENTERLLESVRTEIRDQIGNLGLATQDDVASLRADIDELRATATAAATAAAAAPAPRRKAAPSATKAPARKAPATKVPATKAPAKRAPAKRASAAKKA